MSKAENDRAFEEWVEPRPFRDTALAREIWHAACAYMAERAALAAEMVAYDLDGPAETAAETCADKIRKLVED